jgi:hypothetical protein
LRLCSSGGGPLGIALLVQNGAATHQQGLPLSFSRLLKPVFFVKSGGECNGEGGGGIWRHDGAAAGGTWTQVVRPGAGQFGLFAVDPNDANRILASDLGGVSGPEMVITTDGGATWNNLPQLDTLMTGAGVFRYLTRTGPTRFTGFNGYPQPTLVAFDPFDPDIVVAAGQILGSSSASTALPRSLG